MYSRTDIINIVKKYLPAGAMISMLYPPYYTPAIITSDIDGDKSLEIVAAYTLQNKPYAIVLKNCNCFWYKAAVIKGMGYTISYMNVVPITDSKANNLILGWQLDSIFSVLSIYQLTGKEIKSILPINMYFSKIDIVNIAATNSANMLFRIALWYHVTGDAYNIEVYKLENSMLSPDVGAYPYYFRKVTAYYENKIKKMPEAAFYWYFLADSELKAILPLRALNSINTCENLVSKLKYSYPTKKELTDLKEKILAYINENMLNSRNINLYPAFIKTDSGNKWGYIDNKGAFIIKPQYDNARDFQENGLAVVENKELSGIIDNSGKYIVEPKYGSITAFSEGLAEVEDVDGFKVIDENGKEITSKAYGYISAYKNSRTFFEISAPNGITHYGYLDKEGKEVIPPKYESASDFNNEKAVVKVSDNYYALITPNGNTLHSYKFSFVGNLGDGLLPFKKQQDGKLGYINEAGAIIIPPKYGEAQPFKAERAVVNTSSDFANKYGLIDKAANFIIKPEFNQINYLGKSRFSVGKAFDASSPFLGSRFAIADINGNFLTEFIYNMVAPYKDSLASANNDKYTFFIDETGKISKSFPILDGSGILTLEENLVKANIDYRLSYYDRSGKLKWSESKTIKLDKKYSIAEEKYKPNRDYLVYYPQVQGMDLKTAQYIVNKKLKALSKVKPVDSNVKLDYSYLGDFRPQFYKKLLLVLDLTGYEYHFGAAHGMPTEIYPHIDLYSGKFYELKDLFKVKSNYVKVLSSIIGNQIKNDKQYSYVFPNTYKGIKPDQPFYVDEDNLYIYFEPYEIAPYAAGFPTFKIPFTEIMNIINTKGEFWRAFH